MLLQSVVARYSLAAALAGVIPTLSSYALPALFGIYGSSAFGGRLLSVCLMVICAASLFPGAITLALPLLLIPGAIHDDRFMWVIIPSNSVVYFLGFCWFWMWRTSASIGAGPGRPKLENRTRGHGTPEGPPLP